MRNSALTKWMDESAILLASLVLSEPKINAHQMREVGRLLKQFLKIRQRK